MNRRPSALTAVSALAVAAAAVAILDVPVLRTLLALPLVLGLTGYAITAALFSPGQLSSAERLTCSLALSLAVAALAGVVLNLTPWGLHTWTWSVLLATVTVVAAQAALRRPGMTAGSVLGVAVPLRLNQGLLLGAAALVSVLAIGLAREGALSQHSTPFTQLWIQPEGSPDASMVRVGITNVESTTITYRLELKVAGSVAHVWEPVTLQNSEQWQATAQIYTVPARPVEATLYRLDAPQVVYRQVLLQ